MNQNKCERNVKLRYNLCIIPAITLLFGITLGVIAPSILTSNKLFVQAVTVEDNIKAARQVIDAFNTGNVSNVSDFISEQYFNRESQVDPVRGQLRGPAEFIDTVENLRTAFPDLRHHEEAIIAQDDVVATILNVTGTHTGNFFILPPTGNEISYEAVHL